MSNNDLKFYEVVYTETTSTTYKNTIRASSPEEAEDIIINRRLLPYTIQVVSEVGPADTDREIVTIVEASTDVTHDDFRFPVS